MGGIVLAILGASPESLPGPPHGNRPGRAHG